ncbi:hypothetical protein F4779DRAFT_577703 [Xylariaceae sp. FL0662B]|nr:hypothetical protein F4779DRAFT_577703 [Xylariaceae sp. FL0662B]
MDAVSTAIGLAGAVFKLVVVSIDFFTDAKEVYKNSATDENLDLAMIANNIQSAADSVESQLQNLQNLSDDGEKKCLDPDEEELRSLALRAAGIGNELAASLKKVHIEQKSTWQSFKVAIRGMWDSEDLRTKEKRLHHIEGAMTLNILIGIRKKAHASNNEGHQRELEALERLQKSLKEDKEHIKTILAHIENSEKERLREMARHRAEIDGSTSREPHYFSAGALPPRPRKVASRTEVEDMILDSLWYSSIRDREESIQEPYERTLVWIYKDPKTGGKTWDNFVDFLTGDSRMYWITGKAGSGKTTLVKFINDNPQTGEHLARWAGGKEVLSASFYFFYNGSDYQKSHLGMLRTLLHSLLSQRRDLVSVAFGSRFRMTYDDEIRSPPLILEMKRAFKALFLASPDLCFFLSVDGLDEFDQAASKTTDGSLIEVLQILSSFPNVKLLVSSRPLPQFENAFAGCSCLSIHELTRDDINHYVMKKLESHRRMQILLKRDPLNARNLIESIVSSSAGVFLWVRLVTESLLGGLTNCDSIHDLQLRLEELPSDIYDLFKVMLSRVEPKYRRQSAQLLELVRLGIEREMQLSVLGLWFAEQADHDMVLSTDINPIDDETCEDRVNEMEGRLKSRCLGLVEIQPTKRSTIYFESSSPQTDVYSLATSSRKATARFLHRSVHEFLHNPDIRHDFIEPHCHPEFDARLSLLRSSILILKSFSKSCRRDLKPLFKLAVYIERRAYDAEGSSKQSNSILLHEFDSTMSKHLIKHKNIGIDSPHWSYFFCNSLCKNLFRSQVDRRDMLSLLDNRHWSFIVFAVRFGLELYIKEQVAIHGQGILLKEGMPLLGHALFPILFYYTCYTVPHKNLVRLLLDNGLNPQHSFGTTTVWGWFLRTLHLELTKASESCLRGRLITDFPTCSNFVSAMKIMIIHGADLNIPIYWEACKTCTLLLALNRIHKNLSAFSVSPKGQIYERKRVLSVLKDTEEVIKLVTERGGVEREWENGQLIFEADLTKDDVTTPSNKAVLPSSGTTTSSPVKLNDSFTAKENRSRDSLTKRDAEPVLGTTRSSGQGGTGKFVAGSGGNRATLVASLTSQQTAIPHGKRILWNSWKKKIFRRPRAKPLDMVNRQDT